MRRLTLRYLMVPVLLALASSACTDDLTTTPTDDTTATTTTTETFSDTLTPNGGKTHTFAVTRSGTVTATLASLSPDNTLTIGLSLGTWNGATCQTVIARDNTQVGNAVVGQASASGILCIRVYDIGRLTEPTSYEVLVVHP